MGAWIPRLGQAFRAREGTAPGGVLVFWRHTYSFYDGEEVYFLIERAHFYEASGEPDRAKVHAVTLPQGSATREGLLGVLDEVDEATLPAARCAPDQAGPVVWWRGQEAPLGAKARPETGPRQ